MPDSSKLQPDVIPARHYASMFTAVGWLRGALYGVLGGDIDITEIERLLEATSTNAIASVLGLTEDELFVDTDVYLSENEKRHIGGIRDYKSAECSPLARDF